MKTQTSISRAIDYRRVLRNAVPGGALTATTGGGSLVLADRFQTTLDATNLWTATTGGTGTVAVVTQDNLRAVKCNIPANADVARLQSKALITNPYNAGAGHMYKRLCLEAMVVIGDVASHDNTKTFIGFGDASATVRTSNNLIGFCLASDVYNTLTDKAGTETVTPVAGAGAPGNWALLKLVVRNGAVDFYYNGALKNTHAANLPEGILEVLVNAQAEAAGSASLYVSSIRSWFEDWN